MVWYAVWALALVAGVTGLWVSASAARLAQQVRADVEELLSVSVAPDEVGRRRPELPAPVAEYLSRAIGESSGARWVRFRHGGRFRTKLDGPWQRIAGQQYDVADPPGFIWWGRLALMPAVWIDARDRCVGGRGGMRVWLDSSVTLFDRAGDEMDQGAMLRLLSDLVLLPWVLRDERYVTWEAMDPRHARATLRVGPTAVTGIFEFGADGFPSGFFADRFLDTGSGAPTLTPWSGEYADYRKAAGYWVPHHFVGYWHLTGRRVPYADFRLHTPEYDAVGPFDAVPSEAGEKMTSRTT